MYLNYSDFALYYRRFNYLEAYLLYSYKYEKTPEYYAYYRLV